MSSPPSKRPSRETRHTQLLDAALDAFREKGVGSTSVEDIVQRAGVAKGTFYLYFSSKDDAINAVVERMVDGVIDSVESSLAQPIATPVERLKTFGRALVAIGSEPHQLELAEQFHRPENRVVHERMTERVSIRLAPLIERIIEQGITDGCFRPQDSRLAAWCVLGTFQAAERDLTDFSNVGARIAQAEAFALRGLGYGRQS